MKESTKAGMNDIFAEFAGTLVLVFAITASIAGSLQFTESFGALNLVVVAFTAGLVLTVLINTFGPVSGAHFNPAVTVGLWFANRFPKEKVSTYLLAQFLGGILASAALWAIVQKEALGATTAGNFGVISAVLMEIAATAIFMLTILAATGKDAIAQRAGMTIGFCLLAAHLFAIPFSGASLNPARSLGPALFAGGKALSQLWVYFAGPAIGAVIGTLVYKGIFEKK